MESGGGLMAAGADDQAYDGYGRLVQELRRRWKEPQAHPTFAFFFIASFLIFAATGVWLEFARLLFGTDGWRGPSTGLRVAIATYFPAVLGSSVLQLSISESLRSLRALGQLIAPIFFALAATLVFASGLPDWAAILLGLLASAAALACWWIVNADERSLRDEPLPPPEVTTGGVDPTAPLLGGGALEDFK
jgi:hypothetical protein